MSNTLLGNASNERREQNKMKLRQAFNHHEIVTVAQAATKFVKTESTIKKWAKEANIPLMIDNNTSVVEWNDNNQPIDMPKGSNPGDAFMLYLQHQK